VVNPYEGTHDIHALIAERAITGISALASWVPDLDRFVRGRVRSQPVLAVAAWVRVAVREQDVEVR
jgi:hypothetical protein